MPSGNTHCYQHNTRSIYNFYKLLQVSCQVLSLTLFCERTYIGTILEPISVTNLMKLNEWAIRVFLTLRALKNHRSKPRRVIKSCLGKHLFVCVIDERAPTATHQQDHGKARVGFTRGSSRRAWSRGKPNCCKFQKCVTNHKTRLNKTRASKKQSNSCTLIIIDTCIITYA